MHMLRQFPTRFDLRNQAIQNLQAQHQVSTPVDLRCLVILRIRNCLLKPDGAG